VRAAESTPPPLRAAAAVVFLEAVVLAAQGAAELVATVGERIVLGATTSVFFLAYGAGLAVCAHALFRRRSWARAPVLVTQLLQLAVAWSFLGGATTWVSTVLAVLAVVTIAGIFAPSSLAAMDRVDDSRG
jgi:hypothetical protein